MPHSKPQKRGVKKVRFSEWIVIERVLTDKYGQIIALDIYDNEKKQAVFLEATGRH